MEAKALIFDIKRGTSEDGPGIRTTVFFKGCPLACIWCHNPEGIHPEPEQDTDGQPVGEWIGLEELLYRLRQDRPFYDSSGGGVTLSGGEPTLQMDFVGALLKALKAEGIHTAIETCGQFNYKRFRAQLLPWLDLIYFDLKLIDDFQSRRYTGRPNRTILENFERLLAETKIPVIPRIALIPGITDTKQNLHGLAEFLHGLGIEECTLLPYNPTWQDKIKRLGLEPRYRHRHFLTPKETTTRVSYFRPRKQ